jgi:hypothetical protein
MQDSLIRCLITTPFFQVIIISFFSFFIFLNIISLVSVHYCKYFITFIEKKY